MIPPAGRWLVGAATVLALGGCASPSRPAVAAEARVSDSALSEISGLAASRLAPDRYWAHNDSGDGPRLFALDGQGRVLGTVRVAGVSAPDWEDLASFTLDGIAWLLIADVGDNLGRRTDTTLHLIREPAPATLSPDRETVVRVVASQPVRYPGGPRDCEAMAVDPVARTVLLVSKRSSPAEVFTLPLALTSVAPARTPEATRIAALDLPPLSPFEAFVPGPAGPYGLQPTALDVAPDGRSAVLLTYAALWHFTRGPDESWAAAMARRPTRLASTGLFQAEALGYTADADAVIFTTEGAHAPLRQVLLP